MREVKYGPKIAHQGGGKCPCDLNARGKVWLDTGLLIYTDDVSDVNWSRILVYQLEVKPVLETASSVAWVYRRGELPRFSHYEPTNTLKTLRVKVSTCLEDGLPISGSWEEV